MNFTLFGRGQGYFVRYGTSLKSAYRHRFCGPPPSGFPECPNCNLPLLHFFTVDLHDARLDLEWEYSTISFVYCWRCQIAQEEFSYRQVARSVELVKYGIGPPSNRFPYEHYPVAFPESDVTLIPIGTDEQQIISRANLRTVFSWHLPPEQACLCNPQHQLGGQPYLVQGNPEMVVGCPLCSREMPFLLSVADDCLDDRGFSGSSSVQVLYFVCANCSVVTSFHEID